VDKPEKEKERWRSDSCDVMLSLIPRIRALYSVPGGGRSGWWMESRKWKRKVEEEGERVAVVEANGGKGCPYSRDSTEKEKKYQNRNGSNESEEIM